MSAAVKAKPVNATGTRKLSAEELAALQDAVKEANEYMSYRDGQLIENEYNAGYYSGLATGLATGSDYDLLFDVWNLEKPYTLRPKESTP